MLLLKSESSAQAFYSYLYPSSSKSHAQFSFSMQDLSKQNELLTYTYDFSSAEDKLLLPTIHTDLNLEIEMHSISGMKMKFLIKGQGKDAYRRTKKIGQGTLTLLKGSESEGNIKRFYGFLEYDLDGKEYSRAGYISVD